MNNKFKALLTALAICSVMCFAAACSEPTNSESSSGDGSSITAPDSSGTETPDSSGTETPEETKYTVKFVDYDDAELSSAQYEEGATVTVPADPTREDAEGYSYTFAGWDKEVTAATTDITYKATYTSTAIEYEVSFTHPETGEVLVEAIEYTVETMDEVEFPSVPEELAREHYTVAWDKTEADLAIGGLVVSPIWTPIEYALDFVHPKTGPIMELSTTFTIENKDEVAFPAVPEGYEMEGYTVAWDKTAADLKLENTTVTLAWTANTYTLTFSSTEGSVEAYTATYDAALEGLPTVPAKAGCAGVWKIDGEEISADTIWKYTEDKEAVAVYTEIVESIAKLVDITLAGNTVAIPELAGVTVSKVTVGETEVSFTQEGENLTFSNTSALSTGETTVTIQTNTAKYKGSACVVTAIIKTVDDFKAMRTATHTIDDYYVLGGDVDFASTAYAEFGATGTFKGTFDGRGFTIKNFFINNKTATAGLFGDIITGTSAKYTVIKNFAMTGVTNGGTKTGALASYIKWYTNVVNVYIEGSLTRGSSVTSNTASNGYFAANATSLTYFYNCVAVDNAPSTIDYSDNIGVFLGAGISDHPTLSNCYAVSAVGRNVINTFDGYTSKGAEYVEGSASTAYDSKLSLISALNAEGNEENLSKFVLLKVDGNNIYWGTALIATLD